MRAAANCGDCEAALALHDQTDAASAAYVASAALAARACRAAGKEEIAARLQDAADRRGQLEKL